MPATKTSTDYAVAVLGAEVERLTTQMDSYEKQAAEAREQADKFDAAADQASLQIDSVNQSLGALKKAK